MQSAREYEPLGDMVERQHEICACEHERGYHWHRSEGVMECGKTGCNCKRFASKLDAVPVSKPDADAVIAELERKFITVNGLTAPGGRTLDDFMRDMGIANDISRAALALAAEWRKEGK